MNQIVVKKKPRNLADTKPRAETKGDISGYFNDTTLVSGREVYERGIALYQQGKVKIAPDGHFQVDGFIVDAEAVTCSCPDYMKQRQPCSHFYASRQLQKYGKPENGSQKRQEASGSHINLGMVDGKD